jgi:hypothetical protein
VQLLTEPDEHLAKSSEKVGEFGRIHPSLRKGKVEEKRESKKVTMGDILYGFASGFCDLAPDYPAKSDGYSRANCC